MNYLNRIRSMYHHNVLIENLAITHKDLHCLSSFKPSQAKRGSVYRKIDTSCSATSVAQFDVRPAGDQEVVGNILSWRLIMKYFLRSFSFFR